MKNQNFKSVKIGDKVRFIDNENKVNEGVVYEINNGRTFYVEYPHQYTNVNGVIVTYSNYIAFNIASGKKASHRNTHGDCIEIL